MSVVAGDPAIEPLMADVQATVREVLAGVARGDVQAAARQFVEEVALGPGAWAQLPAPLRATMIDTAPAFLAEQQDANWASLDPAELSGIELPVLLTQGDESPPWFPAIVAKLAEAIESAKVLTYSGAGHAPHLTHPDDYLAGVTDFLAHLPEPAQLQ
jgi:pimeloyl-ACP methyl ester carboxylesterase